MKKIFPNKVFYLLITLLSIFSCNKDDSNSDSDNSIKLLTKVTSNIGPTTYPQYARKDTLVYRDGKIVKSFIGAGCDPSAYQYEYGNNGKISKIYEVYFTPGSNVEDLINMFENSTIIENAYSVSELEYDSQQRLISIINEYNSVQYLYDNNGRLYKKIFPSDDLTYTVYEFDDNGNPLFVTRDYGGSISEHHFEYGQLKNPYYEVFQKFGLVSINCGLDDDFITPNVITHSGSSSIDFTYFSDGDYPTSVHFETAYGDNLIYEFSYR